ncbi:MAG: flagellar hook-length control protein FliK [Parvibaculum sp.]|uniref:flagellar hook-length control protein FliK n=1 Tax=Parvibaculum sp. TaxID=2024848 RepID=UPI003C789CCF
MGLPSSVSFRTSQIDPTSVLPTAARQNDAANGSGGFERHLDASRSRDDRTADRRQRDRSESTRDAQKPEKDTSVQKDADSDATESAATPIAAAPVMPVADAPKSVVAETGEKAEGSSPDAASLQAGDQIAADKPDAALPDAATNVATGPDTPKIAEATAPKSDEKAAKGENKDEVPLDLALSLNPAHAAAPAAQTASTDLKPDAIAAAAPVPAAQTPLVALAANANTDSNGEPTPVDETDPDAGLTIKGKDGLGHEAAASLAEKSDNKTAAAQQATPNAQQQPAQSSAVAAAPTNFAKMVANTTGGDGSAVTATSTDSAGTARLSDLQNVGSSNQNSNTATVRVGTLPGQTTPTQIPAMTIALQVARNLQKGVNRFDIRLDPAEMGRIDVRMEVKKDGNVAAHLIVDRPETLDLLQRDARALQQALNDAGLQANGDSLEFSLRDQNAGGNAQGFGSDTAGTSSTGDTAAAEETIKTSVYNINLSATGGVDIRV